MEWTWLKDWWRLKKLRRNNLAARHGANHHHHHRNANGESGEETDSSYGEDDEDICFCDDCMNVRFILMFIYFRISRTYQFSIDKLYLGVLVI